MPPIEPKRWTSNSEAQRKLKELFDNGDISPTTDPKQIFRKHDVFNKHFELATFRLRFRKIRNERGASCINF